MSMPMSSSDRRPPVAPKIPWGRIAAVHFSAALVVMFAIFVIADGGFSSLSLIWLGVLPVTLGGALPPYLGAVIAWFVASSRERGRSREIAAVILGAVVGSVIPALLITAVRAPAVPGAIAVVAIVVASALGFALWVIWAWRDRVETTDPEPSLN